MLFLLLALCEIIGSMSFNRNEFTLVRTAPPRNVREMYARGIVQLFPYLMDPFSKNGYLSILKGLQTKSKL
jgi:hypothetical protein